MEKFVSLKRLIAAGALCAGVMAAAASPAQAALQLVVTDGVNTSGVVVTPGGGLVQYACGGASPVCPFAGWTVNVSTGVGDPVTIAPQPDMDLAITATSVGGGGSLFIYLTQTGNTTSPAVFHQSTTNNAGGGTGAVGTEISPTNGGLTAFGPSASFFVIGPQPLSIPVSSGDSAVFTASGPYSATIALRLDQPVISSLPGTFNLWSVDSRLTTTQVPEPASLALLGTGLVMIGRRIRRQMRQA